MNIFDQYGIREVANLSFENLNTGLIDLFIDTAKVSTVEVSSDNVTANGGWGNPDLVMWDNQKQLNLNIEDALMSPASLNILLAGGKGLVESAAGTKVKIRHNKSVILTTPVAAPSEVGNTYKWINLTKGTKGNNTNFTTLEPKAVAGDRIVFFWETEEASAGKATKITIRPDQYPDNYQIVGDALKRSRETGTDTSLQFVVYRGKILTQATITMQPDGDPSTFTFSVRALQDPVTKALADVVMYE